MLSTTVEPECPDTLGSRTTIGTAADEAQVREASKSLAQATIHPAADRVAAYGATARADSPAVHRRVC